MSEQPDDPATVSHTDISVSDQDIEANQEQPETSDPGAFFDDGTLGGLGGAEQQSGGAG